MSKTERAYMERAWARFAKQSGLGVESHDASTERGCFVAGWRAAVRAANRHNAKAARPKTRPLEGRSHG